MAKQKLVCVKGQLQQEKEVELASSMLASDLATKLDKQDDEVHTSDKSHRRCSSSPTFCRK